MGKCRALGCWHQQAGCVRATSPGGRGAQLDQVEGKEQQRSWQQEPLVQGTALVPGPAEGLRVCPLWMRILRVGALGLGQAGATCRRPTARVGLHAEPSPASSGPSARVQEATGVVPLAHLSPSGVEMWRLSAAGQGWSEAHAMAGSWFPGARGPERARCHPAGAEGTTGQGCEEGFGRARVG